ncbi:MAG: enoyl-CoA hydratase [Alphaproteobacteria bacterium]|nr:enoyl-CoA hydratase [Alphaproteobacteria bacterium]
MEQSILLGVADGVATITLNRPDKLNAFTVEMVDLWADRLEEACRRDDIDVIIMTGAGRAFCSGGDISLLMRAGAGAPPAERRSEIADHVHRIPRALAQTDKPVIAAMNGVAAGAGLDLALMADLRFAATSARFAETYVRMALTPGAAGAHFLPRRVGLAKAFEMFWGGEFIDAQEAERIGLINRVLPDDELMAFTEAFAKRLANGPRLAIRAIKRLLRQSMDSDLATSLDMASTTYGVMASSADHAEAISAFLEKREPRFKGR